jgi:hypothetical protein
MPPAGIAIGGVRKHLLANDAASDDLPRKHDRTSLPLVGLEDLVEDLVACLAGVDGDP